MRQDRRKTIASIAFISLFVGWASLATAQTDVERARSQFQQGTQAYQTGNYEAAIEYFEEANRIAPNARLLLYIGQCHEVLGDDEQALGYVERYAESGAEAEAEVRDLIRILQERINERANSIYASASHTVGTAWNLARNAYGVVEENGRTIVGSVAPLFVDSDPAGAEVYLGTTTLGPSGRTPLRTSAFIGPTVVIVELPFHRTFRQVVDIQVPEQGSVTSVFAYLERGVASVDISVRPISARVTYISPTGDQRPLGTGGFVGELPAGPGVFLIQHAGDDRRVEHVLDANQDVQEFTLYLDEAGEHTDEPDALGTLVVRSNLAFATVTVDGATVGTGLGEFSSELTPGLHTIRVCQDGYHCAVDNVRVDSGERQTWLAPVRLEEVSSTPWGGIVTAGLAGVAAGAGIFFLVDASAKRDDGDDDGADTSQILSYASFGVAGAMLITSIVLFVNAGPDNDAATASASPFLFGAGPTASGWGVSFSTTF